MERSHSGASWWRVLAAPSELAKERRPLCRWVRRVLIDGWTFPDGVCANFGQKCDWHKILCISLQEVNTGPLRIVFDSVFDDPWSHCLMTSLAPWQYIKVWNLPFTSQSSVIFVLNRLYIYFFVRQVASIRMQGLLLLVFSKLKHVPFIRDIRATYTRTGIFRYWVSFGYFANVHLQHLNSWQNYDKNFRRSLPLC